MNKLTIPIVAIATIATGIGAFSFEVYLRRTADQLLREKVGQSSRGQDPTQDSSRRQVPAAEPARERTDVLARFETRHLGAFIHDPMTAGEDTWTGWQEYFKLPTRPATAYRPVKLDVEGWVSALAKAGVEYAVLNVKEGYGFCLWDSKYTDYDVAASDYKTDVVAEFVKACRKYGIAPSLHYCLGKDRYQQRDKGMTEEQYYT